MNKLFEKYEDIRDLKDQVTLPTERIVRWSKRDA